jgi:hypothetical protein
MQTTQARAMPPRLRSVEVQQVQAAAIFQHASDLAQRPLLVGAFQVMEHERGKHAIEGPRGIVHRIRETTIELNRDSSSLCLASSSSERLLLRVETDDLDTRKQSLDEHGETPRATPDIEHTMTRLEVRLDDELPPCAI